MKHLRHQGLNCTVLPPTWNLINLITFIVAAVQCIDITVNGNHHKNRQKIDRFSVKEAPCVPLHGQNKNYPSKRETNFYDLVLEISIHSILFRCITKFSVMGLRELYGSL